MAFKDFSFSESIPRIFSLLEQPSYYFEVLLIKELQAKKTKCFLVALHQFDEEITEKRLGRTLYGRSNYRFARRAHEKTFIVFFTQSGTKILFLERLSKEIHNNKYQKPDGYKNIYIRAIHRGMFLENALCRSAGGRISHDVFSHFPVFLFMKPDEYKEDSFCSRIIILHMGFL